MVLRTDLPREVLIDGINIEWISVPNGWIEGWEGIVYYFQTKDAYDAEIHKKVVAKAIKQLQSQSYDHGSEWRQTNIETVLWNKYYQRTLVSFKVKDSY